MNALVVFLSILMVGAVVMIAYTIYKTGSIVGMVDYYIRSGVMKHWLLVLVLALVGAGFSTVAGASTWFDYTEVYVGLEAPWEGSNIACVTGAEPDDLIGSNLGIAQHIVSPAPSVSVSAQWTHHSCAIGPDAPVYDAVGIMVRWRIEWGKF